MDEADWPLFKRTTRSPGVLPDRLDKHFGNSPGALRVGVVSIFMASIETSFWPAASPASVSMAGDDHAGHWVRPDLSGILRVGLRAMDGIAFHHIAHIDLSRLSVELEEHRATVEESGSRAATRRGS